MRTIITAILLFITCNLYGQAYSTINFIGRGTTVNVYTIYINQHLVGTIKGGELLQYKMYAVGDFSVLVTWNDKKTKETMSIEKGGIYYFECYGADDREVSARKGKALLTENKSTITAEEDREKPLTSVAPVVTDLSKEATGFLVNRKGYILTVYHVITNGKKIQVMGIGGDFSTLYGAEIVSYDIDLDLALLKIKNQNISFDSIPYKLSSETSAQGAKSLVLGYPLYPGLPEEIKAAEGIITSRSGYKGTASQYKISATVEQGNSGSPLFNAQGDVIGIVNAKTEGAALIGYALKSPYILAFLTILDNVPSEMNTSTTANLSITDKTAKFKNFIFVVKAE